MDPSFASSTIRNGNERGVSYFDSNGDHREMALADNEYFLMGPYGENGEPRQPYIRTTDAEGNVSDTPFADFATAKELMDNNAEQHETNEQPPASSDVFWGIYGRIAEATRTKTTPQEFVADYFQKADRLTSAMKGKNAGSHRSNYLQKLANAGVEQGTFDRGSGIISEGIRHSEELINSGRISKETAGAFWESLPYIKNGLSLGYNALTRKKGYEGIDFKALDQASYHSHVLEAVQSMPEGAVHEQKTGGFYHFNSKVGLDSDTTDRIYISTKPDADPGLVIKTWMDTLISQGLEESVYFKLPSAITNRYEGLVVYLTEANSPEQVSAMMHDFVERCDPGLLDDQKMPSGVELSPGIFAAPEPGDLNALLRYATRRGEQFDTVSYNEFSAAMTELSLRLAAREFSQQGIPPEQLKPRQLAEGAERYFAELMLLSGLDPNSMTDVVGDMNIRGQATPEERHQQMINEVAEYVQDGGVDIDEAQSRYEAQAQQHIWAIRDKAQAEGRNLTHDEENQIRLVAETVSDFRKKVPEIKSVQ